MGDVEPFLAQYWSRAPLHRPGAAPDGFADLLSLDDVDHLVSTFPRQPALRLVRDGQPLDPAAYTRSARLGGKAISDVGNSARIYEEFDAGATIVLQGLHRYWPAVTAFCRDLELALTHPAQANAYVTPPSSRGLSVHHDTHDVFVLQIAGAKDWAVYAPVVELPLPSQRWSSKMGDPGEPILSAQLQPGDCLYIPRGFLHSARSGHEVTAHLTVGVLTYTWYDVVRDAIGDVADEVELRRSLPVGFARDEESLATEIAARVEHLRDRLQKVDSAALAKQVSRRFWSTRWPILTGQLAQLMAVDQLDDASLVRRRPGSVCRMDARPDGLACLLGDRELSMPAELEPVMRRITEAERFSVADLGDQLDQPSRLVLARRLVREGLLEMVTA